MTMGRRDRPVVGADYPRNWDVNSQRGVVDLPLRAGIVGGTACGSTGVSAGAGDGTHCRTSAQIKSESFSASATLSRRPQSRHAPALPPGIAQRTPQRDWGHFPQRRLVYNPWELNVTTCIAAICQDEGEDRIIQCADRRIGVEGFAYSETGFKLEVIGPQ